MTPADPEAQPRPADYEPPLPEHRRPHPKGKPTPEEVDEYVRELERRLRITPVEQADGDV